MRLASQMFINLMILITNHPKTWKPLSLCHVKESAFLSGKYPRKVHERFVFLADMNETFLMPLICKLEQQ